MSDTIRNRSYRKEKNNKQKKQKMYHNSNQKDVKEFELFWREYTNES